MRIFLAAVAAAMLAGAGASQAAVVDVLSGDVIKIEQKEWRVANIDAPSLTSQCTNEQQVARLARDKLAAFVSQGELEIKPTGERDNNDRAMALISINGEDVGEKMIAARLAQRHGEAKPLCRYAKPGTGTDNHVGIVQGWRPPHVDPPKTPY
jgi:endonuclease YncB( thermonuclease family)